MTAPYNGKISVLMPYGKNNPLTEFLMVGLDPWFVCLENRRIFHGPGNNELSGNCEKIRRAIDQNST